MQALQVTRFGGPEVLELHAVDTPDPPPGEVLVRVRAAGVNFGDIIIREGNAPVPVALPLIPGSEAAGTVEAVGDGVTTLGVGDRVAVPIFVTGRLGGGYAEYVAVPEAAAVPLPDEVSFETAAALQMQALTASTMLDRVPPDGKTVVVHAAAGGVGSNLVQMAKQRRAGRVIATAGGPIKTAAARELGADLVLDYRSDEWVAALLDETDGRGADVVYDPVGGDVRTASFTALADEGTLVIYGIAASRRFEPITAETLAGMYVKAQTVTAFSLWPALSDGQRLRDRFAEIFAASARGELSTTIGCRLPLRDGAKAHEALQAREVVGKAILIP